MAQIRWATYITVGLAPIAFVLDLLRARLARSAVGELLVDLHAEPAAADLHDPALLDEPELLGAVTAAAGIALENGRLHAELRARVEELRGSRARIVDAGQTERKRLERNLHDGAQQRLIALSLELGLLEDALRADSDSSGRLARARREIATSLEELRAVARGLHPAVVSGHGLEIALEQLAARGPVPVRLEFAVGSRLPERLEVAAFYLVSESLANIGKHARATSASVEVSRTDGLMVIEVVDDGVGGADTEQGSGQRGLADRVEALEGRLVANFPLVTYVTDGIESAMAQAKAAAGTGTFSCMGRTRHSGPLRPACSTS